MLQTVKDQSTDYASFVYEITAKVKELMGDNYTVRIYKVTKNNSLELDSLVVLKEGKNFAPNIYLMSYYESYLEGTPIDELAGRLCSIYRHCAVPFAGENFTFSYHEMKSYIIYRIVNFDSNLNLLSRIPYVRHLDLAVTFHCLVRNDDEGIGTIRITNDHIKMWQVSLKDIFTLAVNNTRRLFPPSIRRMDDVIHGMIQDELSGGYRDSQTEELLDQIITNKTSKKQQKMFILSNKKGINGASCILYEDVLRKFADHINSDFYILPSSIHEILLVPYDKNIKKDSLTEMVRDVNRTQVAPEEVLSDHVYLYSREKNKVLM